ncbi:RNA polymerase sigma-B factor [Knoellia remsis]|uniref:RNA polymerase sigma-B factor n=1 Tax=Knoellia remsis TaxID=407159 RepID=A0A2T0U9S6_9MICO|nr:sigma-70 family RNA polymerase sigma factor [Knoellia remsis]PRY54691.1 RNA polymerase sigma-B factor [Knoellia remsis]
MVAVPLSPPAPAPEQGPSPVEQLLDKAQACSNTAAAQRLRDEAICLSLDLADSLAHRYTGRGVDTDDLVQVARLGLVKAVARYRPGLGHGFAAFAVPTITGEIKKHFRDRSWAVRPPRGMQELTQRLLAEEEQLRHELGHEPDENELAARLEVAVSDIRTARNAATAYRTMSLDAPIGGRPVDVADERDLIADLATRDALHRALRTLTPREATIVRLRFVEECTQSEIGQEIGVSQMQVSRLLTSILVRLRSDLETASAA